MRYATHLACAALGFLLAWWIWRDVAAPEPYAPAQELPSGAVVAERVPDAPLPPVAREAARELGGTVARAGSVTAQPTVKESLTADGICLCAPDPVRVDWTLTSLRDGSSRMSWYTDDGEITEAVDIPVAPVRMRRDRPWAAMAYYLPTEQAGAVTIERDLWRGRVAAGAMLYHGRLVPMVGGGIRF